MCRCVCDSNVECVCVCVRACVLALARAQLGNELVVGAVVVVATAIRWIPHLHRNCDDTECIYMYSIDFAVHKCDIRQASERANVSIMMMMIVTVKWCPHGSLSGPPVSPFGAAAVNIKARI